MTRLVHGEAGCTAQRATEIFFGAEIGELTDAQLGEIFADVPSRELPRARLDGEGLTIVDALVEAGLAKNKSEARRTVEQGGAYVNNRRVEGSTRSSRRATWPANRSWSCAAARRNTPCCGFGLKGSTRRSALERAPAHHDCHRAANNSEPNSTAPPRITPK